MEVWIHTFAFPRRVAELAARAEAWGFTGNPLRILLRRKAS